MASYMPLTSQEIIDIQRYRIIGPLVLDVTRTNSPDLLRMARHVAAAAREDKKITTEHWENTYNYEDEDFEFTAEHSGMNEALREERDELERALEALPASPLVPVRQWTQLRAAIQEQIDDIGLVLGYYEGVDPKDEQLFARYDSRGEMYTEEDEEEWNRRADEDDFGRTMTESEEIAHVRRLYGAGSMQERELQDRYGMYGGRL